MSYELYCHATDTIISGETYCMRRTTVLVLSQNGTLNFSVCCYTISSVLVLSTLSFSSSKKPFIQPFHYSSRSHSLATYAFQTHNAPNLDSSRGNAITSFPRPYYTLLQRWPSQPRISLHLHGCHTNWSKLRLQSKITLMSSLQSADLPTTCGVGMTFCHGGRG